MSELSPHARWRDDAISLAIGALLSLIIVLSFTAHLIVRLG